MQGIELAELEKVDIPDLTDEDYERIAKLRKELSEHSEFLEKQALLQRNFLNALFRRGQVYLGKPKPRKKPGRHQRLKTNARLRSRYLRGRDSE